MVEQSNGEFVREKKFYMHRKESFYSDLKTIQKAVIMLIGKGGIPR